MVKRCWRPRLRAFRSGQERPENIVGILHVRILLRAIRASDGDLGKVDVTAIARAPWFVPECPSALGAAQAFRGARRRRARGRRIRRGDGPRHARRTFWRRSSATSPTSTTSRCRAWRPQPDGSVNVDGGVPIRDLNRADGMEAARRRGDHRRRPRHSRGALDPGTRPVFLSSPFTASASASCAATATRITALRITPLVRKPLAKADEHEYG